MVKSVSFTEDTPLQLTEEAIFLPEHWNHRYDQMADVYEYMRLLDEHLLDFTVEIRIKEDNNNGKQADEEDCM